MTGYQIWLVVLASTLLVVESKPTVSDQVLADVVREVSERNDVPDEAILDELSNEILDAINPDEVPDHGDAADQKNGNKDVKESQDARRNRWFRGRPVHVHIVLYPGQRTIYYRHNRRVTKPGRQCTNGDVKGAYISSSSTGTIYTPYVFWKGSWVPICGHYFWDNNDGASTFCKKLGHKKGGIITEGRGGEKTEVTKKDSFWVGLCGSGEDLLHCSKSCNLRTIGVGKVCGGNKCGKGQVKNFHITCSGTTAVQSSKGSCNAVGSAIRVTPTIGRKQWTNGDVKGAYISSSSTGTIYSPYVFWKGSWVPICGHYFWDNNDGASTFCKKLGHKKGGIITEGRGGKKTEVTKRDSFWVGLCSSGEDLLHCSKSCNLRTIGAGKVCNGNKCGKGQVKNFHITCSGTTARQSSSAVYGDAADPKHGHRYGHKRGKHGHKGGRHWH